jgi:hypothetical protein
MGVMVTKEKSRKKDCARVQNGKQPTIVGTYKSIMLAVNRKNFESGNKL